MADRAGDGFSPFSSINPIIFPTCPPPPPLPLPPPQLHFSVFFLTPTFLEGQAVSTLSVQILRGFKEKMRLCETNGCARSAWSMTWRSSSTPANILCAVRRVVLLLRCAPSAGWTLRALTKSSWHKHIAQWTRRPVCPPRCLMPVGVAAFSFSSTVHRCCESDPHRNLAAACRRRFSWSYARTEAQVYLDASSPIFAV